MHSAHLLWQSILKCRQQAALFLHPKGTTKEYQLRVHHQPSSVSQSVMSSLAIPRSIQIAPLATSHSPLYVLNLCFSDSDGCAALGCYRMTIMIEVVLHTHHWVVSAATHHVWGSIRLHVRAVRILGLLHGPLI